MGDRKSTKKPLSHVKKHLRLTLTATQNLQDEAYCQILKQITENPKKDSAIKGWNFLAILACSFAPTPELYYSILNFLLLEIKNTEDVLIRKRCNYIFIRLVKTFENKRRQIPSDKEIEHIEVNNN
jgi:hypothetical protein